ncbi:MAG: Flp pilus assembly protein CpaB [Clostridiales bacterium GWF2_38_85]|nr:MAG: Flp pilus assembly protein CpaB [Clostridiales bacterium GWF2_38_85]HBL83480.1 Flp pilus assembly protein CpaB [Clostridiales bacterium]
MKKIYLIATIVAIITGMAVFLFASELQKNSLEKNKSEETIEVVVAAIDITENTRITTEMLTTAQFPSATVPVNAVKDITYLIGKTAKYPISKGEQFLETKILIIGDQENNELAKRVQNGYRAFTISVDAITGIAGYLRIGDKIDIIITKNVDGIPTTNYLLQDIKIIAIGSSSQYPTGKEKLTEYSNITLEILAEDCTILNHNIINGLIKIVLRSVGDEEEISVAPISN